jgi:hypothetical protein
MRKDPLDLVCFTLIIDDLVLPDGTGQFLTFSALLAPVALCTALHAQRAF